MIVSNASAAGADSVEFDGLVERPAFEPRTFKGYGGSMENRTAAHEAASETIDSEVGVSRGWV